MRIASAGGLIDSAGLLELLTWFEKHFAIPLRSEDIIIDRLGTITLMAQYVLARSAHA